MSKVVGTNDSGDAVKGTSTDGGAGVRGIANGDKHVGVRGESKPAKKKQTGDGVVGVAANGNGVVGASEGGGCGVKGTSKSKTDAGVRGVNTAGGPGGAFVGNIHVVGSLIAFDDTDVSSIRLDPEEALVVVGRKDLAGSIAAVNDAGKVSVRIDGAKGDIVLANGDCAEDFDVASDLVVPGTVMVIGANGTLRESDRAYDRRVAGIVAGAGDCKPAIVLGRRCDSSGRLPVALTGRVYCRVEAETAAIDVGDLLTTSSLAGHAMKAGDPARAFGAVIGKAMEPLARGRGLIAVLVSLQ